MAGAGSEIVTQAEFARRVGATRQRIGQLVSAGRLPTAAGRRIPWAEGKAVWDADRARAPEPAAPARPVQQARQAGGAAAAQADDPPGLSADLPGAAGPVAQVAYTFNKARAVERVFSARLREIEWEREKGKLVPIDEVRADAEATAAEVRARLLSLPARCAMLIEGRTAAEIEAILTDAINEVVSAYQESRYAVAP